MVLYLTPHHLSYTTLHMYTCHVWDAIILVLLSISICALRVNRYIYYTLLCCTPYQGTHYYHLHSTPIDGETILIPLPHLVLIAVYTYQQHYGGMSYISTPLTQLDYDVFYALHSQQDMGITSNHSVVVQYSTTWYSLASQLYLPSTPPIPILSILPTTSLYLPYTLPSYSLLSTHVLVLWSSLVIGATYQVTHHLLYLGATYQVTHHLLYLMLYLY